MFPNRSHPIVNITDSWTVPTRKVSLDRRRVIRTEVNCPVKSQPKAAVVYNQVARLPQNTTPQMDRVSAQLRIGR